MWVVCGEESGEYQEFATKKEAQAFIKEAKRFDKENAIDGENWIMTKEEPK